MISHNVHSVVRPLMVAMALCGFGPVIYAQTAQVSPLGATGRSISAVGYRVGKGSTKVDLVSTGLIGRVRGEAKIDAKPGLTMVEVNIEGLHPPLGLGAEFLTYVLWAVSPEGRAINLGEVLFGDNGEARLKTTTQLQTFSLFVTAEPYSAVRQPSEILILENAVREDTRGTVIKVNNYQLMERSQYQRLGNPLALSLDLRNVPLAMYEARNSVEIARSRGAEKYAPDIFSKAELGLKMAENALARKSNKKEIVTLARQTAQSAEDARALTAQKKNEERIAAERAASAAAAAAETKRVANEEARRQAELTAANAAEAERRADEEARRQAELASAREAQLRAEAALAQSRADAERQVLKAREEAAKADADAARLAAQRLREQLLVQFNRILETRDTSRGLVITMADVLFDTGKYELRSGTREQLAKLSGVLLGHPGLFLEIEGHTDSTGSDDLNQRLSEQRASTVRDYLVTQGMPADNITAKGLGKSTPVASNDTPSGRQKNRRVELVVSGEVIGVTISDGAR
jgi:outer membrane protein OmpA-like peptidoglycan-associated protein